MNDYHITTFDGVAYMHFFTKARDSKRALIKLQKNSTDYKNICRENNSIEIKIVKI